MNERYAPPQFLITLAGLASFVIVVAGMRAAQMLVVPFLLALFLSILCAPPLFWLKNRRVPTLLALMIVIAGMLGIGLGVVALVGHSVNDFLSRSEEYTSGLDEYFHNVLATLEDRKFPVDEDSLGEIIDPQAVMGLINGTLSSLQGVLTNAFLILLTVIFILLEWTLLDDKLRVVFKGSDSKMDSFYMMLSNVRRYMALKTVLSFITAGLVYIWLTILGVDYAMLWGLLAFVFNFIPNIGSIIAAVPAVAVALITLGWGACCWTIVGYLVINIAIGNFLDPKLVGRDLGLSTLVVFISLAFWGWVLGPVGMLMSVPLTVTAKLLLEHSREMRWLAVLLGSGAPPVET